MIPGTGGNLVYGENESMKAITPILGVIHLFVGLGALAGGYLGMSDPTLASMGANAEEMLRNAPFETFFIPGLFLFVVIGLGNLAAAVTGFRKWSYQGYVSGVMGGILMAWILIQCYMLWEINALHIIFFTIGAVQALLALVLAVRQELYPTGYFKKLLAAASR